jgi:predicted HicB family RNase H-like nuclease
MISYLSYKGYTGVFGVDPEAKVIRGRVVDLKDVITFQGETVRDVVKAFHESVDDYLEFCESLGEAPEKPFSGKFLVRVGPKIHRDLTMVAQIKGVSVNKLVTHELIRVVHRYKSTLAPLRTVAASSLPVKAAGSSKAKTRSPSTAQAKKTKVTPK